jgi:hypothetical protein
MSTAVFFTALEMDRLSHLPELAQRLYMLALRPRASWTTRTIGAATLKQPSISWHATTEWLYVEPRPGVQGGAPSINQVRRAACWLVKAGLVKMRSNEAQRVLVFFLPLMKQGFFVSNKADSKPTDEADRPLHRGKTPKADRPSVPKADTHLDTGLLRSKHLSDTTTTLRSGAGEGQDLHWPAGTPARDKATMKEMLRRSHANGSAQVLIDELAGATEKGAVRNGPAYLRGLIARFEQGTFSPERANAVADRRDRAARIAQAQRSHHEQGTGIDPKAAAAGRAILARVRAKNEERR